MKKMNVLLASLMLALSSTAFASAKSDASAAISAAQSSFDATAKAGNGWTTTEKDMKDAKAAFDKHDYKKAKSLAEEVQAQCKIANQQGKDQAKAGPM